jgi:hypothetical protein
VAHVKQLAAQMTEDVEARWRGLDRQLSGAGAVRQSKQQAGRMSQDVGVAWTGG